TGGTGVTGRDVTPEAFHSIYEKEIAGFGELFRWLSYEKIGTSTIQSRATAGVAGGTYLFALPGSPGACRDAWDGILVHQLDNRLRPCNFVELMPRIQEHLNGYVAQNPRFSARWLMHAPSAKSSSRATNTTDTRPSMKLRTCGSTIITKSLT